MNQKDILPKNNDFLNVMFRGTPCSSCKIFGFGAWLEVGYIQRFFFSQVKFYCTLHIRMYPLAILAIAALLTTDLHHPYSIRNIPSIKLLIYQLSHGIQENQIKYCLRVWNQVQIISGRAPRSHVQTSGCKTTCVQVRSLLLQSICVGHNCIKAEVRRS